MEAKIKVYGFAVALAIMLSFSSFVALGGTMEEGDGYVTEFDAGWASAPPTIDGIIDVNEWGNGNDTYIDVTYTVEDDSNYTDETVYIYFMNDADYFYFAFDFGYMTNDSEDDGVEIAWAIDTNTDDTLEAGMDNEPFMFAMINQTMNMVAFSSANALFAGAFDVSENIDVDHYMIECAIPMYVFGDVEDVGFALNAEVAGNESFAYPIVDASLEDLMSDPIDSSGWAIVTFNTVAPTIVTEDEASTNYAMYMFAIGTIIFTILLVAHKETFYKWIAHGEIGNLEKI